MSEKKKLRRQLYNVEPLVPEWVEPDVCGDLPSGERCVLQLGHDGTHQKFVCGRVETDYQDV